MEYASGRSRLLSGWTTSIFFPRMNFSTLFQHQTFSPPPLTATPNWPPPFPAAAAATHGFLPLPHPSSSPFQPEDHQHDPQQHQPFLRPQLLDGGQSDVGGGASVGAGEDDDARKLGELTRGMGDFFGRLTKEKNTYVQPTYLPRMKGGWYRASRH
jgi:hypothetical protein